MSPLNKSITLEQDWEAKAHATLVAIRRNYTSTKRQTAADVSRNVAHSVRVDAVKSNKEGTDSIMDVVGMPPPVWLFSTYVVQLLMKRNVIDTVTNRYLLVSSCAQASIALTLLSFAMDMLFYLVRDEEESRTKKPWDLCSLLTMVLIGLATGFMNFLIMSVSFFNIRPVVLSFFVMAISIVAITKITDAVNDMGFFGACKNYLAKLFLPGPKEWTGWEGNIPHDLCCPISQMPFVDPVILNDMVFEREFVLRWIIDNGTHPIDRGKTVSVSELRACPEMGALVREYARHHGMRKVSRAALL